LVEAYHYARFRWWSRLNLESLSKRLSENYDVKKLDMPRYELVLSMRKDHLDEYLVKSDTLSVFLAPTKAVMSQKKAAPFTNKDLELRNRIKKHYPARARSEPQFERSEEKE
jgi:hypothetical protein